MPYKQIITADVVRRRLLGIEPYVDLLDPQDYQDCLNEGIQAAQQEFEERTQVFVWPRTILTFPTDEQVIGVDYDIQEDQRDYHTKSFSTMSVFYANHKPIVSVERLAIDLAPDLNVLTYPTSWIRINKTMGRITILPLVGIGMDYGLAVAGSAFYLPLLRNSMQNGMVPTVVSIDYTAGISDFDTSPQWSAGRQCIARMAALNVRHDLAGRVPNSGGREGLSASFQSAGETESVLTKRIDDYIETFRRNYLGWQVTVV